MWIMTPSGFFSAVQHNDDPTLLVVRTRDHSDAETLLGFYVAHRTSLLNQAERAAAAGQPFPMPEMPEPAIVQYDHADYPWRVITPKDVWGRFVAMQAMTIDYGNFKDAVKERQGADRARVYSAVWSDLLALEDLDPMGRERTAWEPDDDLEVWENTFGTKWGDRS